MKFNTYILENGLRVIHAPSESNVVYCGIAVAAGTRDELPEESGMAHFTEHMSFKGTARRSSLQIINRLDSVGGDLNAYTGKEETVYYCAIAREHAARAIELLLDIALHSQYPQQEMDKEVEVVVDEIESYNDNPSELIFDEFESLLFEGHPLGRNILGDADRLRRFTSEDMHRFARRLYRPERMVLYVYGTPPQPFCPPSQSEIAPLTAARKAKGHSSFGPCSPAWEGAFKSRLLQETVADCARTEGEGDFKTPSHAGEGRGGVVVRSKGTHQAHVMLGTRACAATAPQYLPLYLLNNILGGPAMNSRFNLALRERRGLVYTVESNLTCYTDTGVWSVYFGCDPGDVNRCLRLVRGELKRLTDRPLSARQLAAAKRQLKGQIVLSFDNPESVAIGMGKRFLHYGTTLTCSELCARIDALTADDLWQAAREVFNPDRLLTLKYK